jgi:hypothetical protein
MQSKDYFKNKARKLAKQTWAGPGKFGVFIVLCIIIVATFESLGLSNREKNLEMRSVQNIVIPVNEKVTIDVEQNLKEAELQEKLKMSTEVDFQRKILERENILLYGAVEQYLFEHQAYLKNYEADISQDEKTKFFLSLILKKTDELVDSNPLDLVVFDI